MDYEQLCAAIREMAENSVMILSDEDREFVLGLHTILEIGEPVPASYSQKVVRIYGDFQHNQYL